MTTKGILFFAPNPKRFVTAVNLLTEAWENNQRDAA